MKMRPTPFIRASILLLAAALGLTGMAGTAAAEGMGVGGKSGSGNAVSPQDDRPGHGFIEGPGGMSGPEGVAQRLSRTEMKWADLKTRFTVHYSQRTAPLMRSIEDQLTKARELLAAGNFLAADMACNVVDGQIGELLSILHGIALKRFQGGTSGSGGVPQWGPEDMKNAAEIDIQRDEAKLAYFTQLLSVSKNPRAAETLDKVRALLDKARMEISSNRPEGAHMALSQVEPLFFELQRLVQEIRNAETQQTQDPARASYKDQQPGSRTGMAQANEVFRRVQEKATRAKEQARSADNPKIAAANARIQDLLDKAKEALGSGQAEAAKEYGLKAEGMLAELHRSANAGGARLSPAAWQRLQAKLDRAGELVAASKSDKAFRILEKGKEHFERAQRSHSEGQAARAEVEMDLALKLAAKAVDIARSGPR